MLILACASDREVERQNRPKGKAFTDVIILCSSNFATLNLYHRGNATVSVCVGRLYPNYCHI